MISYNQKLLARKKNTMLLIPEECILMVVCNKNNLRASIIHPYTRGVLYWVTSGKKGFISRKKMTSNSAKEIGLDCAQFLLKHKVNTLSIHMQGQKHVIDEIIIECVQASECKVSSLVDVTPLQFAGCRAKKTPTR